MNEVVFGAPTSSSLPLVWFGVAGESTGKPYVYAELVTPGWASANGQVVASWPHAVERFEKTIGAVEPSLIRCARFVVRFGLAIETSEARWWVDVPLTMRVLRAFAGLKDRYALGGGLNFRYVTDGEQTLRITPGGVGGCSLERASILTARNT